MRTWAFFVGVLASGCGATSGVAVSHVPQGENAPAVSGDPLPLKRTDSEGFAEARAGFHVVRTDADWERIWPEGRAPARPAGIDPARSMLFVAAAEDPSAVSIRVVRMLETASAVHVYVRETKNGDRCPLARPRPAPRGPSV
jgi:hypothetical protein